MSRKLALQTLSALILVTTASTANACVPPVLNPFVWLFGCGCDPGCGYSHGCGYGHGCGLAQLFCGTECGYGGYGHDGCCAPAPGGYAPAGSYSPMGTSTIYSPSWPSATGDCGCDSTGMMPQEQAYVPYPQATAWAPASPWGYQPGMAQRPMPTAAAAWSPNQRWNPASAWAPQQAARWTPSYPAPRSAALPTAPVYGPWVAPSMNPAAYNSAAGDITGDHEGPNAYRTPVHPAGFRRQSQGVPVQPVSYGMRPRPVRRYDHVVR